MADELEMLKSGDADAIAEVFSRHRDKLQRMVRFRLDRRLYGRDDTADVLQRLLGLGADEIARLRADGIA